MKPGPVIAMVLLVFLGMWLVLQPALSRSHSDLTLLVGAHEIMLQRTQHDGQVAYNIISPRSLRNDTPVTHDRLDEFIDAQINSWNARPAFERHLLGFFNITSWGTFGWVAIGLVGQAAFFGRMFVQWIISERSRVSTVPEIFWWFSFIGGLCLFTYFVWRVDIVGVLGQSTGIVIYARNLKLIHKEKQRCAAPIDTSAEPEPST
ncbi:MAG: lipid-A-disaccharide synthase N-terminal domain-containing protein [Phycisphaerales bacterium JB052]